MASDKAALLFDLDGTLVDTAPDLIAALNWCLTRDGFKAMEPVLARPAIGHGARAMIEQSLALQNIEVDAPGVERMHAAFLEHYAEHIADESQPFPGLHEALVGFQ